MTHYKGFRFWLVVLSITAHAQGKLEGSGAARRFVSEKYAFSIDVPVGWTTRLTEDTPLYFNYPASRALPQGRLPKGGAMISVITKETLSGRRFGNTLSEWALKDMDNEAGDTPTSPRSFQMPRESSTTQAIVLSYDSATFSVNEQKQHCVAIYWVFDQKYFAAYLFYISNDPSRIAFEKVFQSTVRSFRPLRSPQKN